MNAENIGSATEADKCAVGSWTATLVPWAWLLALALPSAGQTVVGSAWVMCNSNHEYSRSWHTSGPIVGAIINQTNTTIIDAEIELSIITRDKSGVPKRQRDARFVVVPSLNQNGMVTKLEPNGDVYFSVPAYEPGAAKKAREPGSDFTCPPWVKDVDPNLVLNVAAISITRINGKSLLPTDKDGKPLKQAPLESMLQVPRYTPERPPTRSEIVEAIVEKNELLQSTIINNQLQDCLSRGTWACTFNNDTNINVVISQQ